MKRKLSLIILVILMVFAVSAHAAEPTQAEWDAFNAAKALQAESVRTPYLESDPDTPHDPNAPAPPTPAELKQQAIDAYKNFIVTYPESMLAPQAQYSIGWCYFEINDHTNAIIELGKVIGDYPTSGLVDDAFYQIAFTEFSRGNYQLALSGFQGVITDYQGNENENLSHKVPYAYFMVGECYRMMNDMTNAQAKWNELIVKFPAHNQAGRAYKRLSP